MRKTYMMLVALVLSALGVMNANAGERISLQEVPFCTWDGWGADAQPTGEAGCAWVIGEGSGTPYGDSGVNNYADLSLYSKLYVTVSEGTPRFLLNRDVSEGQWAENEADSHLIDNTKGGWSSKYFSQDGDTYIVDLKLLVKEKGFAHLHCIKGANWSNVTVLSMEVERSGKAQQVGWTSVITNGDMEGDDASSFYSKENAGEPFPSVFEEGIGRDGSRGTKVHSAAGADNNWDAQFWIKSSETLPEGTKYRISFDYRSSSDATVETQAHREPSDYIHYELLGNINFTTDWQTFSKEGEITAAQSGEGTMQSVAFNLSLDKENDVDYFFDNVKFEIYKYGVMSEFYMDVVQVDFGFDTNIADLVAASGKPRLMFPLDCVKLTQDGEPLSLLSVEGFADGRFYIFTEDAMEDNAEIEVTFTNPTDPAYHLTYTSGPGGDVNDFSVVAVCNEDVANVEDAYSYLYVKPTVIATDPEDGSFNLPNSIKEFKITFDKNADCSKLEATLNGKKLTVSPAEGFASEVTLLRSGDDLPSGQYTLKLDKIMADTPLVEDDFGSYQFTINVGKVELDPTDVEETVMTDDFAASGASWIVTADAENAMQDANSSAGCRLMHGQSGFAADILYLGTRTVQGVALYGTKDDAKLALKAKNYHLTLGAAKWDGNGASRQLTVQVLPETAVDFTTGALLDETQILAAETKAIEPDFKSSANATRFDIVVPVTVAGNYIIRMVTADGGGNPAGYGDASAIGNIMVQYFPNTAGAEFIRLLTAALETAKANRDKYAGERYEGEAFTALNNAITKYETEMEGYTSPSAYKNAAADLETLAAALEAHGKLCDEYDTQIKAGIDVVRQNEMPDGDPAKATKFVNTDLFKQVKETVAKYNGTSEWRNVADTIADPEAEEWQLFYSFDVLKVESELTAAIDELKVVVRKAGLLFSEGVSETGDAGTKVLVDRIRRGAATMKALGIADDDELMVAANRALTDDDALADAIKKRIATTVYAEMAKGADCEIFKTQVNEETLEEIVPSYDMSVFAKNPNTYVLAYSAGYSPENVPGWDVLNGNPGVSTMWRGGTPYNVEGIAEDMAFTTYRAEARIEQTVTDLPVGVYTVVLDAASWADDDVTNGFVYVKTSQTPVVAEGEVEDSLVHFAATSPLEYYGQYVGHHDHELANIVVADGVLTFGVNFGAGSQWMFDQVKAINLTAPVTGFDYKSAYDQLIVGIDATPATAKIRAIQLYDLNGRQLSKAQKGINILRKLMDDGTIVTEKVIIK
ncbi:MAG: carbohydrate binding domain-containing protein [Prevotella sp.]|nr:carbohydrate binding domain-containing protein [Prevotella sp.]